ncbi:hypothetical protein BH23VER1_BH23VER1_26020 [soil metagenome]
MVAVWLFADGTGSRGASGSLVGRLHDKLVERSGGSLTTASPSALVGKEYVALYFSAHWCPPCRAFTPVLSRFYDEVSRAHPEFQLILVSGDRDAGSMEEYIRWGEMNFPAVAFDRIGESGLREYSARGIPYLVVLDAQGNEIIGKGSGESYREPGSVLAELKGLLAGS